MKKLGGVSNPTDSVVATNLVWLEALVAFNLLPFSMHVTLACSHRDAFAPVSSFFKVQKDGQIISYYRN